MHFAHGRLGAARRQPSSPRVGSKAVAHRRAALLARDIDVADFHKNAVLQELHDAAAEVARRLRLELRAMRDLADRTAQVFDGEDLGKQRKDRRKFVGHRFAGELVHGERAQTGAVAEHLVRQRVGGQRAAELGVRLGHERGIAQRFCQPLEGVQPSTAGQSFTGVEIGNPTRRPKW